MSGAMPKWRSPGIPACRRACASTATCHAPVIWWSSPTRINEKGFFDAAPHRASLPSAYQGYRDVETDPVYSADREAEHILFFPLFFTSFLIDDFLADEALLRRRHDRHLQRLVQDGDHRGLPARETRGRRRSWG